MSQVERQYQIIFDTPGRVDFGSLLLGLHSSARELHPYHRAAASLKSPCQDGRWIGGAVSRQDLFIRVNAVNVAGTTVLSATIGTAFRPEACPFLLSPNCKQQDMLLIGVDAPHTHSHTRTPNGARW